MSTLQFAATRLIEIAANYASAVEEFNPSLVTLHAGEGVFLEALKNDRTIDPKADKGAAGYVPPYDFTPEVVHNTLFAGFRMTFNPEMPIDSLGVTYGDDKVAFCSVSLPPAIIEAAKG